MAGVGVVVRAVIAEEVKEAAAGIDGARVIEVQGVAHMGVQHLGSRKLGRRLERVMAAFGIESIGRPTALQAPVQACD